MNAARSIPWLAALGLLAFQYARARHAFDEPARGDGNSAHTYIDFGGQWLMGRMLATGYGPELYQRDVQRLILVRAYPVSGEVPRAEEGDVEHLMRVMMDLGDGRGGPLYPPVEACLFLPYALGDHPQAAYFVHQWVLIGCILGSTVCAARLMEGRVSVPAAVILLLLFPGLRSNLELGQNGPVTLLILLAGWLAKTRNRHLLAGVVWGLLAYKPVWAASFFLALLFLREWRMALVMLGTGVLIGLVTLPFVGLHSWFDWLAIGAEAAKEYQRDGSWIRNARDLLSLPRRWLVDFWVHRLERDVAFSNSAGQAVWLIVFLGTLRGRRTPGFLFLSAYLLTYHFMWYDAVVAFFPLLLLIQSEERRATWVAIALFIAIESAHHWLRLPLFPWDTLILLALWAWLLFHAPQPAQGGTDVRLPHQ